MKRVHLKYLTLVIVLIITGLASRRYGIYMPEWVVEYLGDILWAGMVYFGIRLLVPSSTTGKAAVAALLFSYLIEFSQLYQAAWMRQLRSNPFLALVLGQGFLWSDLVCYTIGVLLAFCLDRWWVKTL